MWARRGAASVQTKADFRLLTSAATDCAMERLTCATPARDAGRPQLPGTSNPKLLECQDPDQWLPHTASVSLPVMRVPATAGPSTPTSKQCVLERTTRQRGSKPLPRQAGPHLALQPLIRAPFPWERGFHWDFSSPYWQPRKPESQACMAWGAHGTSHPCQSLGETGVLSSPPPHQAPSFQNILYSSPIPRSHLGRIQTSYPCPLACPTPISLHPHQ